jgi:hypothetical protein
LPLNINGAIHLCSAGKGGAHHPARY